FRLECEGVSGLERLVRSIHKSQSRENRAGWVCTAGFVAMRIGSVDQSLIGECELGSPVDDSATGELIPLLVDNASDRIAPPTRYQPAWYLDEMLAILSPTQTCNDFEFRGYAVIGFPKCRIGIQHIGVLAQKIIMAVVIDLGKRIWINIATQNVSGLRQIVVLMSVKCR